MSRIATYPAALFYEVGWNAGPLQVSPPPNFTDITARAKGKQDSGHGRDYELNVNAAGTWNTALDNTDGALDPTNTSSPFAPNVLPYRPCRIRTLVGANALSVDQATAGEGTGYLGAIPPLMSVVNDFSYPLSIVTSGSAYQGSQVYQAVLPNGAPQFATVLLVQQAPVIPGKWYAYQAQVRITAGNSVAANAAILWYDQNGNPLTPAGGSSVSLVSGVGTWSELAVSWQAPVGAFSAALKIEILAALTAQTTFQIDGLQYEQSATATSWQMPLTVSPNLLPRAIATGTASINPADETAATWFYPTTGTVTQASFLTAAPPGQTMAVAWTSPIGTSSASPLYAGVAPAAASAIGPVQDCVQVTATTQYTASMYLMRLASADATVQVTASLRWFDINGNLLSTSSGTAATVPTAGWVRASCTATAPAGAVWCRARIFISSPASTTAQNTIYAAAWQFEAAGAASTWADPGMTKHIFTGFIEQFPQQWRLSGTWGELDGIAVDGLGGLGQDQFQDPFIEECLAVSPAPTFIYTLADPAGSTVVADIAANCPAAPVVQGPYGAGGGLTLGGATGSGFLGTAGPVATLANTPSAASQSPMTYISLPAAVTTPNFGQVTGLGPGTTAFTRMIAFNVPAVPAAAMYLWSATMPTTLSPQPSQVSFFIDTSGRLNLRVTGSVTYTQTYATSIADGAWHLASIGCDNATGVVQFSLDGVVITPAYTASGNVLGLTRDTIGGYLQDPAPIVNGGANASIALAVQFPAQLTAAQIANLSGSFHTASSGESSGARVSRILNWVGWTGPTAIDTGSTTDMGPAADLSGSSALSALNSVATSENGNVYVSAGGVMTFKGRADRYNRNTPTFIFGEHRQYGEWPYEDVVLPVDPIHLYDNVQVTQYSAYSQNVFSSSNQQIATASSAAAQAQYFDRDLARTINVQSYAEAQAAAAYLLGQYDAPTMRAKTLKLHPSAVRGLFAVCLQLEVGTRVRVMNRAPGRAPTNPIQFDGFIEKIAWSIDPRGGGDVFVTLECSPASRAQYWVMAALHTQLTAQAASGQNQATIAALPDSAYNMLSQSLPAGYQLTFDPGTSIAETMTIAPGGIPATNPGYISATLTFTSNFAFTHQATAVVCEPLPQGYINPATWDAFSVLGAGYAAVEATASSGTNTVTVGPWPDAAANALIQNLAYGDLLWLSPGGGNFEGYNRLHPNVATAGEGLPPLAAGTTGLSVGITGGLGTPVVTASGTAWQGSNVWQTSVAANVGTPNGLLYLQKACSATPLLAFTPSVYVRSATTGANPQCYLYVEYLDANGNSLSFTQSSTATLTGSPTAAWTRMTVNATAPAGSVWVQMGVVLTGTSPSISWAFQADGLQVEQAAAASAFQVCPQVKSVAPGSPGYSTCVVTLAANMANSHAIGDTVCDPLPPGTTSPTALPLTPTARLAY